MTSHSSVSFIFAGDTHTSNIYGICTPNPKLGRGGEHRQNEFQYKLYSGFQAMCDQIQNKNRVQAFITMGDLLDGPNLHKGGEDQWTVDAIDAAYDVSELLMPLARMAKIVRCIRGSGYHVSPDRTTINYDELVAHLIGGAPVEHELMKPHEKIRYLIENGKSKEEVRNMVKTGKLDRMKVRKNNDNPLVKELGKKDNIFKRDLLDRSNGYVRSDIVFKGIYHGVAFLCMHDGSYSANPMYRGTAMTRNDVILSLQKERLFPDGYDSINNIYGHAHYYFVTGNASHYNINVPCWKGKDKYLLQKVSSEPDYGIMEIVVEPNGRVLLYPHTLRGSDYPVEPPVNMS